MLLDILISVMILGERGIRSRRLASPSRPSVGGIWQRHKESVEHESNACELPRVRFSDTVSTATDIIEAGTLGRLWFHLSLFSSMMTGMEE